MRHTFVVEVTVDTGCTDPQELMELVETAVLDGRTWGRLRQPGADPNHPCVAIECVDAREAVVTALGFLGQRAGRGLGITQHPSTIAPKVEVFLARLRAADSDGAAQAVCRGLATHVSHGGSIPWPTIRRPFEDWQTAHAAAPDDTEGTA